MALLAGTKTQGSGALTNIGAKKGEAFRVKCVETGTVKELGVVLPTVEAGVTALQAVLWADAAGTVGGKLGEEGELKSKPVAGAETLVPIAGNPKVTSGQFYWVSFEPVGAAVKFKAGTTKTLLSGSNATQEKLASATWKTPTETGETAAWAAGETSAEQLGAFAQQSGTRQRFAASRVASGAVRPAVGVQQRLQGNFQLNVAWKPQAAATFTYGYNGTTGREALELLKASGASIVRLGGGWVNGETWEPGGEEPALTLEEIEATLTVCKELGLTPMLIAGYEPPSKKVAEFVVKKEVAGEIGTRTVEVEQTTGVHYEPEQWLDYLIGHPLNPEPKAKAEKELTNKAQEDAPGTLVASVTGTWPLFTIKLAAEFGKTLPVGTTVNLNRSNYPPIKSSSPLDPGAKRFMRFARAVAEAIHRINGTGYVCLLNEPYNFNNWASGNLLWDRQAEAAENGFTINEGMQAILLWALEHEAALPAGVHYVNGGSDQTGASSILLRWKGTPEDPTPEQSAGWVDGQHPYGENPENAAINEAAVTVGTWPRALLNWSANHNGNFGKMLTNLRARDAEEGYSVTSIASECGSVNPRLTERQRSRYNLRRVLSLLGQGIIPVLFNLQEVTRLELGKLAPLEPYLAVQRLAQLVGTCGAGGTAANCPAAEFPKEGVWCSVAFYGGERACLIVWNRTFVENENENWFEVPSPAPVQVPVKFGAMGGVVSATNLSSGAEVAIEGNLLPVSDDPVLLLVESSGGIGDMGFGMGYYGGGYYGGGPSEVSHQIEGAIAGVTGFAGAVKGFKLASGKQAQRAGVRATLAGAKTATGGAVHRTGFLQSTFSVETFTGALSGSLGFQGQLAGAKAAQGRASQTAGVAGQTAGSRAAQGAVRAQAGFRGQAAGLKVASSSLGTVAGYQTALSTHVQEVIGAVANEAAFEVKLSIGAAPLGLSGLVNPSKRKRGNV